MTKTVFCELPLIAEFPPTARINLKVIRHRLRIEEREAEKAEMLEKDKERRVAELTKKWDDVEAELQRVVDNVCHYLDGTDEKALRQASYENKARLLLMITENYQRSIADEIRVAADKIQLELLPKMKEYQEQAKR